MHLKELIERPILGGRRALAVTAVGLVALAIAAPAAMAQDATLPDEGTETTDTTTVPEEEAPPVIEEENPLGTEDPAGNDERDKRDGQKSADDGDSSRASGGGGGKVKAAQGSGQYLPSEPPEAPTPNEPVEPTSDPTSEAPVTTTPVEPTAATPTTTEVVPETTSTSGLPATGLAILPMAVGGLVLFLLGALGLRRSSG